LGPGQLGGPPPPPPHHHHRHRPPPPPAQVSTSPLLFPLGPAGRAPRGLRAPAAARSRPTCAWTTAATTGRAAIADPVGDTARNGAGRLVRAGRPAQPRPHEGGEGVGMCCGWAGGWRVHARGVAVCQRPPSCACACQLEWQHASSAVHCLAQQKQSLHACQARSHPRPPALLVPPPPSCSRRPAWPARRRLLQQHGRPQQGWQLLVRSARHARQLRPAHGQRAARVWRHDAPHDAGRLHRPQWPDGGCPPAPPAPPPPFYPLPPISSPPPPLIYPLPPMPPPPDWPAPELASSACCLGPPLPWPASWWAAQSQPAPGAARACRCR